MVTIKRMGGIKEKGGDGESECQEDTPLTCNHNSDTWIINTITKIQNNDIAQSELLAIIANVMYSYREYTLVMLLLFWFIFQRLQLLCSQSWIQAM